MYVPYVLLIFLATAHPIDFPLGECLAEDPRDCGVECEVI